jgi:phosphatidylserine/phosphatidylglycerophosphate/cardiolipin synthase-like enzyme
MTAIRAIVAAGLLLLGPAAYALQPPNGESAIVQYAFTPGERADGMIIEAIAGARQHILVQAFSFTHRRIAQALISARSRGVEVTVIADQQQTYAIETSVIQYLADGGVQVLLDSQHASAHNKIMIIDAGSASCAVVTGSYNFTQAAQSQNAENVVILRSNLQLCEAFRGNWQRHKSHALPYQHKRARRMLDFERLPRLPHAP